MAEKKITAAQVAEHNKVDDAWVVINGKVYDVTGYAKHHPGGPGRILTLAGGDASQAYNEQHEPISIINALRASTLTLVGDFDTSSQFEPTQGSLARPQSALDNEKKPLSEILALHEFEEVAKNSLSASSWGFVSTGATDNTTRDLNRSILPRILLRPRMLNTSPTVTTSKTIFGSELNFPFFICPTGSAKRAGPEGELAIARAVRETNTMYCMSSPTSYPDVDVLAEIPNGRKIWFQLYVSKDRKVSEAKLRTVLATGKIGAVFVTVDLPVMSKREDDIRVSGAGIMAQAGNLIDPAFHWDDLKWLRGVVGKDMPIVVKGLTRADDVARCLSYDVQGVQLSNHGGRCLDGAPPSILVLLECHKNCPEVFSKLEILVDGGFRRGTDIVKAICLGASAVGIGRGFLYSVNYGQKGVEHAIGIIQDEITNAMQLSGIRDLERDATPDYVNTGDIDHLVYGRRHPYARKIPKESKL